VAFCALVTAVALAASAGAATQTPAHVTLSLNGVNADDSHHGTFSAPPPLCPAGTWRGDGNGVQTGHRTFTCADGSGNFTADFDQISTESKGGTAPWQITGGTGAYATLRGVGSDSTVITVPGDHPTFTETWQGTVGFDTTPPSLASFAATASRPNTTHAVLRLTLGLKDNVPGNAVSYDVSIDAGNTQIGQERSGSALGPVHLTYRLNVPARVHQLLVLLSAEDPVGNTTAIQKVVALAAKARHATPAKDSAPTGEPKNELPFTRRVR
jgi:hypothetical protein